MSDEEWTGPTEERMAVAEIAAHTELELLQAIDHQDHATREVYADWLEERGDLERAEFVRLQDLLATLPEGEARDDVAARCEQLAQRTDIAWRVLVSRARIDDGCDEPACPNDWGSLAPADRTDERICMTCNARVHYCANGYEGARRDNDRVRYVVDASSRQLRSPPPSWQVRRRPR